MNPYLQFVSEFSRLLQVGRDLPFGKISPLPAPVLEANAPKVVLFSPHPDDECLTGGLPLRLLRQSGMRILNVPVTFGSNAARRAKRQKELKGACEFIGFELLDVLRRDDDNFASAEALAEILEAQKPEIVFFPHDNDFNSTHLRTQRRIIESLERLGNLSCWTFETEFWHPMEAPNLLVESSDRDLADLLAALSFHEGELRRSPYHLTAPAWFIDNVRRGSEVIGGQGGTVADFQFATLYRLRRWERNRFSETVPAPRILPASENPHTLFMGSCRNL